MSHGISLEVTPVEGSAQFCQNCGRNEGYTPFVATKNQTVRYMIEGKKGVEKIRRGEEICNCCGKPVRPVPY